MLSNIDKAEDVRFFSFIYIRKPRPLKPQLNV